MTKEITMFPTTTMVQVRTTGWVGFGVAGVAPNNISNYDVAIGGVKDDGTSHLLIGRNNKM